MALSLILMWTTVWVLDTCKCKLSENCNGTRANGNEVSCVVCSFYLSVTGHHVKCISTMFVRSALHAHVHFSWRTWEGFHNCHIVINSSTVDCKLSGLLYQYSTCAGCIITKALYDCFEHVGSLTIYTSCVLIILACYHKLYFLLSRYFPYFCLFFWVSKLYQ